MAITLSQFIQSTYDVLPVGLRSFKQAELALVTLNMIDFEGMKMRQFNSYIRSSDRKNMYSSRIWFTGLDRPVADSTPTMSGNKCLVRCSCPAYYFFCIFHNAKIGGQIFGSQFKPYVRITPPPPVGLPYKNPLGLPAICKHLIFLSTALQARKLVIP